MHRIFLIKRTMSFGRIRDLVAILPDFFGTEFEAVQIHPFISYLFPIVVVECLNVKYIQFEKVVRLVF